MIPIWMLVVQGVMFAVLVAWIGYFQLRMYQMQLRAVVERAEAIAELKRTADELVEKTSTIAKGVGQDAMDTASQMAKATAGQLDAKIEQILSRFDEAARHQQDVKNVVDDTNVVLHKELKPTGVTDTTTREQIDTIKDATINNKKST